MIYIKTELGKTALHDKSLGLTPRQRSSFIMFDGKRTLEEIFKLTSAIGVTESDINHLVTLGLLAPSQVATPGISSPPASSFAPAVPVQPAQNIAPIASLAPQAGQGPSISDQSHYAKAYLIAVRLTGALGLRGFRLNLAVESAGDLEKLKDLAPKIKEAVGVEKFRELEDALYR
jgi:hypothetical protein